MDKYSKNDINAKAMKKYWFYLKSYIYVSFKTDALLLYNTHSGDTISVVSVSCMQIINNIYMDNSLGCVELTESYLQDREIREFINCVIKKGMGKLLDQNEHPVKPVILLPILSLNFDVDKFKDKENADLFLARDISKYLLDVNIILNNSCQQQCTHCQNYNKQFFCCSKEAHSKSLPEESLLNLLRQISYFPVRTINITGGNIYEYQNLELFDVSNGDGKKAFNFYINYLNYQENPYIDNQKIHLIINTSVNTSRLKEVHTLTKDKDVKYHLIVEDEEQFAELDSAMSELGIEDFEIHPYFNGQNTSFFEDNVYLSKEDILANPISMREIFRNQKLNANSFGSLYVLPDGSIKANMNEQVIGNLNSNRIIDVISDEMKFNTAWRKVRSSEPCKNCIYQFLCPPPSNYERALKRENLCDISL